MKIQDILDADSVWVETSALPKRRILEKMAHLASEKTGQPETLILDALIERERLGTTGIGRGVAIPHSPIPKLKKIFCAFVKTAPMDFEATDGKPVEFLFLLLVPSNAGADHLKALARLSRLLRNEKALSALKKSELPKELYKIIIANDTDE
ncbi:MAG: PTS sugar transporter subunit IIA [Alphaproteobacteria bacterium]|nr:PTS sugar transporter subunit IIA [Alphaproteobacteria bacterium]